MRYHSTFSTIAISIVVLLVFASVALFTVAVLSMTSPTLIATQELLKELSDASTPVSLSFDSMDRNFRDGIFINGLEVSVGGEEVASFERVTVHMGLFSLIRYLVLGSGSLEIEAESGWVDIPMALLSGSGGGDGSAVFSMPSIPRQYSFSIHIHDTDVSIADVAFIDGMEASVYLDDGLSSIDGRLSAPGVSIDRDGVAGEGHDLLLTLFYDGALSAAFSMDSLSVAYGSFSAHADDLAARGSLDNGARFADGSLQLSFSSLSLDSPEVSAALSASFVSLSGGGADAVLTGVSASYGDISGTISRIEAASDDYDGYDAILQDVAISKDSVSLLSSGQIALSASLGSRSISFSSPRMDSGIISLGTGLFPMLSASFVEGSAGIGEDGLSFALSSDAMLSSDEEAFSGTSLSIGAEGAIGKDGGLDLDLSIDDVRLPELDEASSLSVTLSDGSVRFVARYGRYLTARGSYDDGSLMLSALMSGLPLHPLQPYISFFMPALTGYIGDATSATGSVNVDVRMGEDGLYGPSSFSVSFADVRFNDYSFSASASLSSYLSGSSVEVYSAEISTDIATALWQGSLDLERLLPEGDFTLENADGSAIAQAVLELSDSREYSFSLRIPPAPGTLFSGRVDFSKDGMIRSDAVLSSGENVYPIDLSIDLDDDVISLINPALSIIVRYGDGIRGEAAFSSFALPVPSEAVAPCVLNGTISASFIFSEQALDISVPSFQIENMRHLPTSPDISFSAHGNNDGVRLDNIIVSGVETEPLRGSLDISVGERRGALFLSSSRSEAREEIRLSVYASDSGFSGIFRADNLNLRRLGIDGYAATVNLTGHGGSWSSLAFSGSFLAHSTDMANRPGTFSADMFIGSDVMEFRSISFISDGLRISSPFVGFSSATGRLEASADIYAAKINADREYPVTTTLSLEAEIGAADNLAESAMLLIGDDGPADISGHLAVGDIDIDDRLHIDGRESSFLYSDGRVELSGSLASGSFDTSAGLFDISIDLDPVVMLSLVGHLTDTGFEMKVGIPLFEMSVVNILFPVPIVTFVDPAPAHGEVYIVKDGIEWELFGKAEAETVAFDLFWMPGQRVILHDPSFVVWDNSITSLVDDCTVLDMNTYERLPGGVSLSVDLSKTLSLMQWRVDVYAEDGKEVGIRLPVVGANVDIWGDVSGHLSVVGYDNFVELGGDITAQDLRMSVGMEPMPEWWGSKKTVTMDMNLLLRENVSFVMPLGSDPILTAMLAENQRLTVRIPESGGLDISGNLEIRSGEFFYFQKNFYITEGSIGFPDVSYGTPSFNPIINLRARLRDFDSDGRPVDIFLVLRNATLDNISPTFESSPSKDINEIMSILGGAILPTGVYGDVTVSSMFSLVSASVDILSRMGILRSSDTGLETSIRSALSLDTFSIHSNIVENILYDTVSLASSNLDEDNLSPMARYLNGTTLYLGKYISPELYFEGMVHLQSSTDRTDDSDSHTFIADDLDLDIEISLEWNNPMCTVTFFTRPGNITVYDFMDNFGFEISKRIVW